MSHSERSAQTASRRLGRSDGFTLVEVLVAIIVFTLALGGLVYLFGVNSDSALSSQQEVRQLLVLEQQIENIHQVVKQYGFSALALSSNPAAPTDSTLPPDPTDPNDFIKGYGTASETFLIEQDFNNTLRGTTTNTPSSGESLLDPIDGTSGGHIAPVTYVDLVTGNSYSSSSSVPSGDSYATVHTYVTSTPIVGCNSTGLGSCSSSDTRRVVVSASLNNVNSRADIGPSHPTYATTVFTNPIPSNEPTSASGLCIVALGC